MKTYLDEYGRRIEDPAYTPPPGSFVYSTRRGDFVFPADGKLLTLTAEDPPVKVPCLLKPGQLPY